MWLRRFVGLGDGADVGLNGGIVHVGGVGSGDSRTANAKETVVCLDENAMAEVENGTGLFVKYRQMHGDTFRFSYCVLDSKRIIIVTHRTDAPHGWGQHLCVNVYSKPTPGAEKATRFQMTAGSIHVGSVGSGSPSTPNNKVVEVALDEPMEVGSRVFFNYRSSGRGPDRFRFFVKRCSETTVLVMVVRVDASHGWGQDLHVGFRSVSGLEGSFGEEWVCGQETESFSLVSEEAQSGASCNEFGWFQSVEYTPGVELCILDHWLNASRRLLPVYEQAISEIAIHRRWMQYDPYEHKINYVLDKCKSANLNARDISLAFRSTDPKTNAVGLEYWVERICSGIGWRKRAFLAALSILSCDNSENTFSALFSDLEYASTFCEARQIECFHTVVLGAFAKSDKSHHQTQPAEKLRDKLVDKVFAVRAKAFKETFVDPTTKYYDIHSLHTKRDDVNVHGTNIYRAMLLATFGIVADCKPMLFDCAKSAFPVLCSPCFAPCVKAYWHARMHADKAQVPWDIKKLSNCPQPWGGCGEQIFIGRTAFDVANRFLSVDSPYTHAWLDYAKIYISYFSRDYLFNVLVNLMLADENITLTKQVIDSLPTNNQVETAYSFFWELDDEDSTKCTLRLENICALLEFIQIA